MKKLLAVGFAAVLAAGCSTWDNMSRQEKGTVIGAGTGAAVGGATVGGPLGTIGGAAAGGVVGNQVGKNQDEKK
ncbi:MAG: glycine zipper domain-containing protein [Burkholderiaceae bacterium]